jgi:hypothetical protein
MCSVAESTNFNCFVARFISAKMMMRREHHAIGQSGSGCDHINECPARRPGTLERDERCLQASIGT